MATNSVNAKAKGKMRVSEPVHVSDDAGPSLSQYEEPPATKPLVVRFSEGIPDLSLQIAERDAVRDVKRQIREHRPELQDHRLRLIHSGRIIPDGTYLYPWILALESRQRRATSKLADSGDPEPEDASQSTIWVHCSVGNKIEPGEEDETREQRAQLRPLRGFDRLAAAGFSAQDIASFRSQFHSRSARDFLDQDFENNDDFDEHARALEEQWIDSMDGSESASLTQGGSQTPSTILSGLVLGFFFPILPFFFFHERKGAIFWEEGPEHDVYEPPPLSQSMQMGIVIGFVMNVVFGVWMYALSG
ncbi:DUF2407 ubiquitin-like domain-containing protein [Cytidiella melzeri]|nr:DUF2407 ubiquitin-like domain-containing protein [Cytidiella melzeri]